MKELKKGINMIVFLKCLVVFIIMLCLIGVLLTICIATEESHYILKLIKVNKYGFSNDITPEYLDWETSAQYILFDLLLKKEYRKEFEKYYKERYGIKVW